MIVLEANYSKKLGLPGYSSHQYSLTVRKEVSDISQVENESRQLFHTLQTNVDRDIQQTGFLPGANGNGNGHRNGNGNGSRLQEEKWACSEKQRTLILKIVEESKLDKNEVEQLAQQRFGHSVKELNKLEASGLIEELIERSEGKRQSLIRVKFGQTRPNLTCPSSKVGRGRPRPSSLRRNVSYDKLLRKYKKRVRLCGRALF